MLVSAALAISACGGLDDSTPPADVTAAATGSSLTLQPGFPVGAEANGSGTATTPAYAVAATDVVLAFVGTDAAAGTAGFSLSNRTISGGTLSWTRVRMVNTRNGAVAVYRGTPSADLSGVTTRVTATGGPQAYISVVAIAGASPTLGAVGVASGSGNAASVALTATVAGSWVFAVGEDWNSTTRRTLSGTVAPTLVDERPDPALNDYWVERAATAAAGTFRIGTSAPTSPNWNMIAVEVVPAAQVPAPAPAPAPTPAPAPSALTLSPGFPVGAETNGSGVATTPAYAVAASDVVLAFVGTDAPAGAAGFSLANATASGGTLSWTQVALANTSHGAVAVYRGTPSAALTGVTTRVTATGGPQAYISVVAVAGARGTLGAVVSGNGAGTAASLTLDTTAAGSWVFAAGEDWNSTTRRTLSGTVTPVLVDERPDPAQNDYWVERAEAAAAGTFRIGTSAPTTPNWNMVAVEVVPATAIPTPPPAPTPTPTPTPTAAAPSISPGTSTSSSPVTATITCPTPGTVPYRTTDGSTPTTASPQGGTATFSASGTLRAICAGGGYLPGAVASATYTIVVPTPAPTPTPTAAATPSISPGTSTSSSPVTATITCPTAGTVPYRTTDGSTPTTASPQSGTATFSASGTLRAICAGGGFLASGVASAAYTIVVASPVPGTGTAMTTAHRTSGVAPLAVFFDAVNDIARTSPRYTYAWSSGVAQPADMEGAHWSWSFGDPGSGTWSTTGRSKNAATGFTAAHVYETPGTYTATLTVTDVDGTSRTYTQTITVTNPDTVFQTTTRYVAAPASGGSDANPGSLAAPYATIARAIADVQAGTAKRVLLRRGDTFAASQVYLITAAGPGLVGAYGSGAKPILHVSDLGTNPVFTTRAADWRVMDLEFIGPSLRTDTTPAGPYPDNVQGVNQLFLRLTIRNFAIGMGWGYWAGTAAGTPHDGMFIVECDEPIRTGSYGAYLGGRRLALLGNTLRGGVNDGAPNPGTHTLRVWQGHKAVISNNDLRDPGGTRHALKLVGPEPAFPTAPESRWLSITDNWFRASATSIWTVSMGSQSTRADEASYVSHLIIERNRWTSTPSTAADVESEANHAMVRNNVFDDAAGDPGIASLFWAQRNPALPAPTNVRAYNNTMYGGNAFLQTDGTLTSSAVRNCLAVRSGSAPTMVSGTPGSGFVAGNNLASASTAATFTYAAGGDLTLPVGSPAVDAGAALPQVREDFARNPRAAGAGYDVGAFESR